MTIIRQPLIPPMNCNEGLRRAAPEHRHRYNFVRRRSAQSLGMRRALLLPLLDAWDLRFHLADGLV